MKVKVKYMVGRSTKIEFVDVGMMTIIAVARVMGISRKQIISLSKD